MRKKTIEKETQQLFKKLKKKTSIKVKSIRHA